MIGLFLLLSAQAGADSYVGSNLEVKSATVEAPAAAPAAVAATTSANEPSSLAFTGGDVTGMLVLAVVAIGIGLATWRFSVRKA